MAEKSTDGSGGKEEEEGTPTALTDDGVWIDGRDKASATTLRFPLMCPMSLENSEMKERWRVCRGDRWSVEEVKAWVNGL